MPCNIFSGRNLRIPPSPARVKALAWAMGWCLAMSGALAEQLAAAHAGKALRDADTIKVVPVPKGGDFQLQSSQGPVTLDSLRGYVVVLFFGYITCPDICPTTLGTLQQALTLLTEQEQSRVRVLFVSVDPERDTFPMLDAYAGALPGIALGVSGSKARIDAVAQQYGAQYARVAMPGSALRYGIEHSAAVYLIDGQGRLRLLLRHTAPPARFAGEIRALLRPAPN